MFFVVAVKIAIYYQIHHCKRNKARIEHFMASSSNYHGGH